MQSYDHWIDGKSYVSTGETVLVRLSPADGRPIASIRLGEAADVDAAVAAARRAFDQGSWKNRPGGERAAIVNALADRMAQNLEKLAVLEAEEAGKGIKAARAEIGYAIELTRYAASLAWGLTGKFLTDSGPERAGLVLNQPRGVAGLILPWNYPAVCLMQKLPFALAAGCSVVIKPSEFTSGTTLEIARLATEAGIPNGQVNVVLGSGESVGDPMTAHQGIDMITFTGSSKIGKRIASRCAESMKHVALELGGKGANVIFADADLDAAVEGAFQGFTINSGEECCAGGRILVEASIAEEFTSRLLARCSRARLGLPLDENTEMGPLIHAQHVDRVLGYIAKGKQEGARLLTGGEQSKDPALAAGCYVPPTVFTDVKPDMTIFREEIFGPVATIVTFANFDEAVSIANDTVYGLANGLWTSSLDKALAMVRKLRSGTIYVNTYLETLPQLPFGGMKESGKGRENGTEGLQEFLESKAAYIKLRTSF